MGRSADLLRCYEDAALQRYLMRPHVDDLLLINDGWKLSYALDTNVVSCYLDPVRYAQGGGTKLVGVGEVFRDDSTDSKENITRLISDYLLFGLTKERSLIAIQPINLEVKDMYLFFAGQFLSFVPTALEVDPRLVARLEKVSAQHHTEDLKAALTEALRLDMSGMEAVRRIRNITRARRILGSDMVTARTHGEDLAAGLKQGSPRDRLEVAWRKNQWMIRLREIGRALNAPAARDAEALARLQICNERLAASGAREKLIYLTVDNSLMMAGEQFSYEGQAGLSTFSKEFIRHPRAYLDEPEVLRPSRSAELLDGKTLYDWLTVLFERIEGVAGEIPVSQGKVRFSSTTLRSLDSMAEKNSTAGVDIVQKWKEYSRDSFNNAPPSFVNRLIASLADPAAAQFVEQTWEEIRGEVEMAWDCVMQVSAGARFALEVASPGLNPASLPARETPRLVFEGRSALQDFLEHAESWLADPNSFEQEHYNSLRRAVQGEYDGDYGDYMAHAYLLAQQMQWKSAQILASMATSKVYSNSAISATDSNGRESSYLEAYCGRLTSTSKADLDRPVASVLRALSLAEQEKLVTSRQGGIHDCAIERFKVELLVLQMTAQLYDWNDGLDVNDTLLGLRISFQDLAGVVRSRINVIKERGVVAPYSEEMLLRGMKSALGRCYRSGLGLSFQLGIKDAVAQGMWVGLKELCAAHQYPSQFANFVIGLGDVLFLDRGPIKTRLRELDRLEIRTPTSVLPYDKKRYSAMVGSVRRHFAVG